jgi:hypothetical protein
MKRAIFFVLLLAMDLISTSQNLVVNPGFEIWGKVSRPDSWTHVENCLKDSLSVYSGHYSCLHSGGLSTTSDLGQTIAVSPGFEYKLSFYYKTVITAAGNGARIWCYWKDAEGSSVTDPVTDPILRPSKYLKSDTWQQFSISVTAPPGAVAFYLEVRTYPNSLAFWDDFSFEEQIVMLDYKRDESPINIYPNPVYDFLNISNAHNLQRIDIHNIVGVIIWSARFSGEEMVTIPVSGLPDGLYIIRITSSDNYTLKKFIKSSK